MPTILTGLTDNPNQQWPITIPDGTTATLSLVYRPQQLGWFYDLSWDGNTPPWQNNGRRLVAGPNVLRQYRNQIPFGLTVSTGNNLDPFAQTAFIDGTCTLLLLDPVDISGIESALFP
jgi:hypothetical protein